MSGGQAKRKGGSAIANGAWEEPRPPLASRVRGLELCGRAGARPASLRRSREVGEEWPWGSGGTVYVVGRGGQRGKLPYLPALKITGSERFQFRPVRAQLRPICGAILAAAGQLQASESVAPLSSPALGERPALLWTLPSPGGASHPRALFLCLLRGPERCRVSPSCSAGGCAVCPLVWLPDLVTRLPRWRPGAGNHKRRASRADRGP